MPKPKLGKLVVDAPPAATFVLSESGTFQKGGFKTRSTELIQCTKAHAQVVEDS